MEDSVLEENESSGPITPTVGVVRGAEPAPERVELSEETIESSAPFVGRWSRLVSTTNWEKGRIVSDWREALESSGAAVTAYSDEAWAQLVGHVTGQHVGRLRRVHQRFGAKRDQYDGLYWSHFQTALDWDDAEMWLEGAVKDGWSVAKMRAARWEAVGAPDGVRPSDEEVVETAIDEDAYDTLMRRDPEEDPSEPPAEASAESSSADSERAPEEAEEQDEADAPIEAQRTRPFAEIGELPDDVAEAFEQFKLAILNHKLTGWKEIPADDLSACLDALKALITAPSAE